MGIKGDDVIIIIMMYCKEKNNSVHSKNLISKSANNTGLMCDQWMSSSSVTGGSLSPSLCLVLPAISSR